MRRPLIDEVHTDKRRNVMLPSVMSRLNDRRAAAADLGEDAGFTLIELMVVLLILAILLAIAIPTFLGVTKSANDRAAQSNLNTALVNAKSAYQTDGQTYGDGTAADSTLYAGSLAGTLGTAEPSLTFTTGASTSQSQISVYVSTDGNGIILAGQAKSTLNCWYVMDNTVAQTTTTNGPYTILGGYTLGGTATAWTTAGKVPAGTWYGESKNPGTGTAPACSASTPTTWAASTGQLFAASGFPAL
jgi:type IV pilus assembly protein PilA